MKKLLLFALAPTLAWSVDIPLQGYDGSKLEMMLRRTPEALVKKEEKGGFVRHHYSFPKKTSNFLFTCTSDFYNSSPVPSHEECKIDVSVEPTYEEYKITLTDPEITKPLFGMISYGRITKKVYSFDRVYGQALSGKYRDLFRYTMICENEESCVMTFTAKPTVEEKSRHVE